MKLLPPPGSRNALKAFNKLPHFLVCQEKVRKERAAGLRPCTPRPKLAMPVSPDMAHTVGLMWNPPAADVVCGIGWCLLLTISYKSISLNSNPRQALSPPRLPKARNAIAERFVGSIRREALDRFIIFNERQLFRIIAEYIGYYNSKRPHQGLGQAIPRGFSPQSSEAIVKIPIPGGLSHSYEGKAA